ncbi:hypothetical protein [Streptomyces poriferorum]|uniref:Uncharacterized protein n=1 Tax=Streptomyces poriferorum TaxID=2798799 RepID=A0ABY9IQM3_9ACTN|nr:MULTISPECIES: hypothetical protein [unclassified Streptomyces]MDP5313503.1 hypothetical protein [Streptomyces sp. Alt4]WLQ57525.1 hypothetical protein P8A19_19630 [Streptomyces sp. Alt2]
MTDAPVLQMLAGAGGEDLGEAADDSKCSPRALTPGDRPAPGLELNTVLRYANAVRRQDTIPDNRPRSSRLDPYEPYLERRFAEGCTSVTRFQGELIAEQAPVTCGMVPSPHCHLARSSVRRTATATDGTEGDRLAHPTPDTPRP